MAHLSFPLSGIILRHDKFGTHLKSGKIVDEKLFEKNMAYAGICVADNVWNGIKIEDSEVHAEFIPSGRGAKYLSDNVPKIDFKWFKSHCVVSRHSLQIAKCFDKNCISCKKVRSPIFTVLKSRFIPPPIAMEHDKNGQLKLVDPNHIKPGNKRYYWPDYNMRSKYIGLKNLSMDTYNSEISEEDLIKLTCDICKEQFQNQTFLKLHRIALHFRKRKQTVNVKMDVSLFLKEFEFDLRGLKKCVDFRTPDKYLCIFNDGHSEWMSLHEDLQQIQDFKLFCTLNPLSNDLTKDLHCYDSKFLGEYLVYSDSDEECDH